MGRVSKAAQRNISENYRYLISDNFEEKELDFIDYTEEGDCLYLGESWEGDSHQSYVIVLSNDKMIFLKELIKYKFGSIELASGSWHYFIWSSKKPKKNCRMFKEINSSIEGDSQRFWRTIRLLVSNLRINE